MSLKDLTAQLEALNLQQRLLSEQISALSGTTVEPTPITSVVAESSTTEPALVAALAETAPAPAAAVPPTSATPHANPYPSRILLTTYPTQHSVSPLPLNWSHPDPLIRGPVLPSRLPGSLNARNALGAHSGSYSYYKALSIACGDLTPETKVSFEGTEAPPSCKSLLEPCEGWSQCEVPGRPETSKIVSFDPLGHIAPFIHKDGYDVRPSIAITKAHITLPEIDALVASGDLTVDGTYLKRSPGEAGARGQVEVAVSKAAIEPVWYLPGIAHRFKCTEAELRRALFESTGGSYPELITRPDIKVFLPPIGGITVYLFGKNEWLRDTENKEGEKPKNQQVTLRIHDECNGSDVFGSDICTCKPYLIYGIAECVKSAQTGKPGIISYHRKEGRALGEVTKYLVYNLRKRSGDSASEYFRNTERVAGIKDIRLQGLMPDVLHWLGVKGIEKMISMSDMKYNAIVGSGIPIDQRLDLPASWIPPDGAVEIGAKIAAGYFTSGIEGAGVILTEEELKDVKGRGWDEVEH